MDGTIGRPCLQGNPSTAASAVSESSETNHLPYILPYDPQYPPTDLAIVVCLKNKIHGVCEMNKFLDFRLHDPQKLPNARDDRGIYCLTKLIKLKDGGKNFNRETEEGRWVISQNAIPVNTTGVQLGIKTSLFYLCKDNNQSDRWLMKQYTLHQSQWPVGKEEECEKLALCHIYRKHSGRNPSVRNGSSSSITSGANPSQNYPVLTYPREVQSSSILGSGRTDDFCTPNSTDSNPYNHQNQHEDHNGTCYWDESGVRERESQFWNQTFTNEP